MDKDNTIKYAYHIIPDDKQDGIWRVVRTGASKASAVKKTRDEAINYAVELTENKPISIFIHNREDILRLYTNTKAQAISITDSDKPKINTRKNTNKAQPISVEF